MNEVIRPCHSLTDGWHRIHYCFCDHEEHERILLTLLSHIMGLYTTLGLPIMIVKEWNRKLRNALINGAVCCVAISCMELHVPTEAVLILFVVPFVTNAMNLTRTNKPN